MDLDDIIYLGLLFFSIGFGYYYRRIADKDSKKNIGTLLGLLIIFTVSGFSIVHPILTTLVNAAIILYIDKRKCHIVSFVFSFAYLLFFRTTHYFGIPYPPAHTNLVQMILTLKLVGLAFEVNSTHTSKKKKDNSLKTDNFENRKCHIVSFVFSFAYLLFFRTTHYFGIPYPPAHTNLVQMILTLKLVGLAFEVNSTHTSKKKKDNSLKTDEEKLEDEINNVEPSFVDIFHYAFNYIGVLTGPYYRYKTFVDFIELPFAGYSDWKRSTIDKLKFVPLYAVLFLWGSYNWPLSYALTDEFYARSWLYRYWYIWPNFFIFRMRIYIGIVLSECVCTMAGLGAYPETTKPKPGQGPSENYKKLGELRSNTDLCKKERYNFETIHNVDPYGTEFVCTYREAMKHWNICVQYWLAVNVYKRFPNKKYRTVATSLVSAFWHGVYLGYYCCVGTVPLVLALEDVYVELFLKNRNKKGPPQTVKEWIHWFFRLHFFSYQAIAFLLLDVDKITHYYNSIYHAGLVLGIVLYLVGSWLLKQRKLKEKQTKRREEENEKRTDHVKSN